jgi:OOP family OmpA-OmpF porin
MRARIAAFFCSSAFAFALTAIPARATDCSGTRSTCIDDDTLWPHAGPAHFVMVGSTETVSSGHVGASPGLKSGGSTDNVVDDQVNGTSLWSYGVTRYLELDLALALTFGQGGTGLAPVTGGAGLKDTAVRDTRFGLAYAIIPHERVAPDAVSVGRWGLLARFEVSAPTGDRDQFAGERSGVFVPSVAADYRSGRFFGGAEVGARLRPITQLEDARVGSQLVAALGVGYDILPHELLAATLEAWALPTVVTSGVTPGEWQISVRSEPLDSGDLSIQLGGGGGIPFGGDLPLTTPRFRFTLGLRWAPL